MAQVNQKRELMKMSAGGSIIKTKLTTNETDKLRKRIKNKAYMKESRKK